MLPSSHGTWERTLDEVGSSIHEPALRLVYYGSRRDFRWAPSLDVRYVSVEEVNGYLKRTKVGTRGMVYPSVYWPRVRKGSFKQYLTHSVRVDPIQHGTTILWWCTSFLGAT